MKEFISYFLKANGLSLVSKEKEIFIANFCLPIIEVENLMSKGHTNWDFLEGYPKEILTIIFATNKEKVHGQIVKYLDENDMQQAWFYPVYNKGKNHKGEQVIPLEMINKT